MRISDWSSDVCSSDLAGAPATAPMLARANEILLYLLFACAFLLGGSSGDASLRIFLICLAASASLAVALASGAWGAVWQWPVLQIGRASCRVRVWRFGLHLVVSLTLKKKKHRT